MAALNGKVAIVTGGASGIGEAIARRFAEEGAQLLVCDIDTARGLAVAEKIGGHFVRTDVTVEDDVEAAVAKAIELYGCVDCMINNAGVPGPLESIIATTRSQWTKTIDILLNSVFYGIKHAARAMIERGQGSILSTASVSGVSALGPHPYVTAKHALIGLTKSAASELAASGIRVNAVAPGAVPTQLAVGLFGNMEAARQNAAKRHPLKQVIEPEEIADGFVFLASESARNITGQVLTIDGGLTACPEAVRYQGGGAPKIVGALDND